MLQGQSPTSPFPPSKGGRKPPAQLLYEKLGRYLHLEDSWAVDVSMATIVVNAEGTEPLWSLLVGPPSTGKTEFVRLFESVPYCAWLPEVSENTFLSGYDGTKEGKKTKAENPKGNSLLHRWTDPTFRGKDPLIRVMLIQDLTGLLTKDKGKRDAIFGQLRQIYDGQLDKATGMGKDLHWKGYMGLLGAVTPKIEEVSELNATLGERFLFYRPKRKDVRAEGLKAGQRDNETDWRKEMAALTWTLVEEAIEFLPNVQIPWWVDDQLVELARFTAIGRTGVTREGYSKAITNIPTPEGPARLMGQYKKMLRGLCAVRHRPEPTQEEMRILAEVAKDSIRQVRLLIIELLYSGPKTRAFLERETNLSGSTLTYHLQDLRVLEIVQGDDIGWSLTPTFQEICEKGQIFSPQPKTLSNDQPEGDQAA